MIKAAIIQSNYLPWKGYFDIIHDVDIFVFLDDVQYTKRDWRNRNKIKTPGGLKWISVPVIGSTCQMICETKIDFSQDWMAQHKKMIHHSYAASKYYDHYIDDILDIFAPRYENISELNISAVKKISALLGMDKEFINSKDLAICGRKDDKLIEICQKIGADCYLSGPAARDYIVLDKFQERKINLEYKDYSGYPEYAQLWGTFDHYVSIIDLIFNCGERTPYYIWGWRNDV